MADLLVSNAHVVLYLRSIRSLYEHKNYGLLKTNPSGSFVGVFFDKGEDALNTLKWDIDIFVNWVLLYIFYY